MVYSTEAIVLGYINYSETSVIVKCLTKKYGVKSYIIRGIRSNKKSKIQLGHLQRLNIVDLESKENKKGDLSYLKNIKSLISFQSINSDILKYNTALFISEVLISVINHQETDVKIFNFIKNSLAWFDKSEKNSNFHILFLLYLTSYLGIIPEKNINNLKFFDIENGKFSSTLNSNNYVSGEIVEHLSLILGTNFDYSSQVLTNVKQRRNMIDLILKYYKIHVPGFKFPKSVDILNDLFS